MSSPLPYSPARADSESELYTALTPMSMTIDESDSADMIAHPVRILSYKEIFGLKNKGRVPDDLPSYEEACGVTGMPNSRTAVSPSLMAKNGSGTKKTQMELWTEMQQAREACDGNLSYETVEKFYISAMESQHFIEASHILEELEELEFMDPRLRGRSYQLTMKLSEALDFGPMEYGYGEPDCYTSDEEETSELVEDLEMIESRWCQVRRLTPVQERVFANSALVNNVPGGNPIRLTGKKKGNRVQIDEPYKGWLCIENTTLPQVSTAGRVPVPISPEPSALASIHLQTSLCELEFIE